MQREQIVAVDRYLADLFVAPDAGLDAALESIAAAGLPAHSVSPLYGKLLHLLARITGARAVLEIGTLGGYSAIWLARGLAPGGRVLSLEVDPARVELARANLARAGVAGAVEVRAGPALDTLAALRAEGAGPFDLVFVDAELAEFPEYFAGALKLSRPGTVIFVDNVVRAGGVLDPEHPDAGVRGVRRFNQLIASEPRVSATALQTLGTGGHDGFAIALVR